MKTASSSRTVKQMTADWAAAKAVADKTAEQLDALRAEILAALGDKALGYADDFLVIGESSDVDLEDRGLQRVLKRECCLEDAQETKLSAKKLRAIAEVNPRVAAALERATTPKPRFLRAPE